MREMAEFLHGVIGVVEANSFEFLCLWKEATATGRKWSQGRSGYIETIGEMDGHPICLSLLINEVDGHRLLFIHPTSQIVDYLMIDAWLQGNLPESAFRNDGVTINRVDAMNFHNVFPRAALKEIAP